MIVKLPRRRSGRTKKFPRRQKQKLYRDFCCCCFRNFDCIMRVCAESWICTASSIMATSLRGRRFRWAKGVLDPAFALGISSCWPSHPYLCFSLNIWIWPFPSLSFDQPQPPTNASINPTHFLSLLKPWIIPYFLSSPLLFPDSFGHLPTHWITFDLICFAALHLFGPINFLINK